jgi:hypothetical protein
MREQAGFLRGDAANGHTLGPLVFTSDAVEARYGGNKLAATATATSVGDTTIVSPAAGSRLRLFWLSAITDPDEPTNPLIRVRLGATELYRAYAVAHWEIFDGAEGEALVVNLSDAAAVAVTAHYQELVA